MTEFFDAQTGELTFPANGPRRFGDISKLATALAKAQSEIEDATKDSTNPHFKSKYADLASVRSSIRKPLADNGLAYVQLVRTAERGVEVETILIHGESGQVIGDTLLIPLQQMTPQTVGSGISYGRRYSLMSIIGIAADDDDGEAATRSNGNAPPQRKSSAKAKRDGDWDEFKAALYEKESAASVEFLARHYREKVYPTWNEDWRREADELINAHLVTFSVGDDLKQTLEDSPKLWPKTKAEYIQYCHDTIDKDTSGPALRAWWMSGTETAARKRYSVTQPEVDDLKSRVAERIKELSKPKPMSVNEVMAGEREAN